MLEVIIIQRSAKQWEWQVCNLAGTTIMWGWEKTRDAARYRGNRALFRLLAIGSQKSNDRSTRPPAH
jgi:hypothetical protein